MNQTDKEFADVNREVEEDEAHQADMRELYREQLRNDIDLDEEDFEEDDDLSDYADEDDFDPDDDDYEDIYRDDQEDTDCLQPEQFMSFHS